MKPESTSSSASPASSASHSSHALPADDPRCSLSALADGEAASLSDACALWRDDAQARQTWHAYHLIGDVLRSEELARRPARDAAFLAGVRQRLAAEPVVLAPQPVPLPRRAARQPWLMPAAVAAGFVVVAGVLVVTRVGLPDAAGPVPVLAAASVPGVTRVSNGVAVGGRAVDAAVIRNARLDEYLRAHQTARGGVALVAPGGGLRQVDVLVPGTPR